MKFEEMGIEENVLDSLSAIGFEKPTRIQLETIPIIKQGFDVIGQSETGSGKTAAFGIPLIEKVERNPIKSTNAPKPKTKSMEKREIKGPDSPNPTRKLKKTVVEKSELASSSWDFLTIIGIAEASEER